MARVILTEITMTSNRTICLRFYANHDIRWFNLDAQQLPRWIEYNTNYRPGCALVVGSTVIQNGYLDDQEIQKLIIEAGAVSGQVRPTRPEVLMD